MTSMTNAHRCGVAGAPRRFLMLLAISTLILLAGRGADTQERPRYGGELVYVVPTEPASYDGHREGTMHGWGPSRPATSSTTSSTACG
jgi:hypothetical protein